LHPEVVGADDWVRGRPWGGRSAPGRGRRGGLGADRPLAWRGGQRLGAWPTTWVTCCTRLVGWPRSGCA